MSSIHQPVSITRKVPQHNINDWAKKAGAIQGVLTYPLDVMAHRQFFGQQSCTKLPKPFAGISMAIVQRILKSGLTLSVFNQANVQIKAFIPEKNNQPSPFVSAMGGTITATVEGAIMHPLAVIKNHAQVNYNQSLVAVAKGLSPSDLIKGLKSTIGRNMMHSATSMVAFTLLTHQESSIIQQSLAGGTAFLLGSVFSMPLEINRLNQIFGTATPLSIKTMGLLSPGLLKVTILGLTLGPSVYRILYPQLCLPTPIDKPLVQA